MRREFLKFNIGDVEDPDIFANMEINAWARKNCDAHQYLLEHSNGNMRVHRQQGNPLMGHKYIFTAEMSEEDWFLYCMRFE